MLICLPTASLPATPIQNPGEGESCWQAVPVLYAMAHSPVNLENGLGGATQAMLALISGYRHLKPGDTILYCDLDYPAMRHAMKWLRERRGATPVRLTMPEPATHDAVIQTCAQALRDHR